MLNSTQSQDLRLLLPEKVCLEAEHFEIAKQTSLTTTTTDPNDDWEAYLHTLALLGLEEWLQENLNQNREIVRDTSAIAIAGTLRFGEYKFCAIATEHLLDETVHIPQSILEKPQFRAHFYVLLEVQEEEEEVILRGFLPHRQLLDLKNRVQIPVRDNCYLFDLNYFDLEPNHLLTYQRYIPASQLILPLVEDEVSQGVRVNDSSSSLNIDSATTKLSQWLEGVFYGGWSAIDSLSSPEFGLAFVTRNAEQSSKGVKTIDLGIDFAHEKVALLLTLSPETPSNEQDQEKSNKITVVAQLYPASGNRVLPEGIKLALLSKAGKTLQEVTARFQDNYIQLKHFKGLPGIKFSIQISLGDASFTENFEL